MKTSVAGRRGPAGWIVRRLEDAMAAGGVGVADVVVVVVVVQKQEREREPSSQARRKASRPENRKRSGEPAPDQGNTKY